MLSRFHISHISRNLLATCHALTGSNRQRTTGLPLPVVANKRPWQWAPSTLPVPSEKIHVWYLPTTFLLLKWMKVSEFFAVRCGFQICVLPPSLAPQNIWIDVFQQKWSVHMFKFQFARGKDVKDRSRQESETVPFVALEKGIWSSDEAWLSALQVGNHPTQRLCLVWRLTNCYWLS